MHQPLSPPYAYPGEGPAATPFLTIELITDGRNSRIVIYNIRLPLFGTIPLRAAPAALYHQHVSLLETVKASLSLLCPEYAKGCIASGEGCAS